MTALEKLAIELNAEDVYVADEFFNTFRKKCPDEVFPCAIGMCEADGNSYNDGTLLTCVKCWLQEVSE